MPKKPDPNCCLCGLHYERIGNNPAPLAQKGRCCDACNEIVIEARTDPARLTEELARVEYAMLRKVRGGPREAALAAICASRGPGLWAQKRRELERVRTQLSAELPSSLA